MTGVAYLSDHLIEILGLLLTGAGIWFVVQQLREAKLASQMEGMLAMQEKSLEVSRRFASIIQEIISTENWPNFDNANAYSYVYENPKYREAYVNIIAVWELLGVLVRRKALDTGIAYDLFGGIVVFAWRDFKGVNLHRRIVENNPKVAEHWEWLAKEFENYSG